MNRDDIIKKILEVLDEEFEIDNPEMDANLREKYEFDSIDAIALLEFIEDFIDSPLSQEEKKQAMEIRTINDIIDYVEMMVQARS